jgi:hypothetical protein
VVHVVVRPRLLCAIAVLFVMTSCGTPNGTAAPSGGPGPNRTAGPSAPAAYDAGQPVPAAAAVSYADFLAAARSARYVDVAGMPATKVRSESAFEDMRRYVLHRLDPARVSRSYVLADATFDCVGPAGPAPSGDGCPPGTAPVRRIPLSELARFPTLQDFLRKGPDGGGLPPIPSPTR